MLCLNSQAADACSGLIYDATTVAFMLMCEKQKDGAPKIDRQQTKCGFERDFETVAQAPKHKFTNCITFKAAPDERVLHLRACRPILHISLRQLTSPFQVDFSVAFKIN